MAKNNDGTTLFVRKDKKKQTACDVSPAQWIVGNALIQHEFMITGQLSSPGFTDYLGYTAKIGKMPQFTPGDQ